MEVRLNVLSSHVDACEQLLEGDLIVSEESEVVLLLEVGDGCCVVLFEDGSGVHQFVVGVRLVHVGWLLIFSQHYKVGDD